MHRRFPAPVRAADEGGGGGSPATPAPADPAAPAAPADGAAAPTAPATLLGGAPAAQPDTAPPADGQQPGEAKPGDKPADGKGEQPAFTVESYKDLALPEGVPLANPEGLAAFKALFAEDGVKPETAQKLVNLQAEMVRKQVEGQAKIQAEIAGWGDLSKADQEFGGADYPKNLAIANAALKAFATPALAKLLVESNLSNHPDMIRVFYRVGKAMAEDGRVVGSGAPKGDRLSALYPTMVSKE